MGYEVIPEAKFRVVRDAEQGHYFVQAGFGSHFRSFASFKMGKMDQLRDLAKQEAQSQSQSESQPSSES